MTNKLTMTVFAALAAAIWGSGALAADWKFFHSSSTDNTMLYYDADGMATPTKDTVSAWVKQEVKGKIYSLTFFEINCVERKQRTLIKHGYDSVSNEAIKLPNAEDLYPSKYSYIVPDTVESKLARHICPKRGN